MSIKLNTNTKSDRMKNAQIFTTWIVHHGLFSGADASSSAVECGLTTPLEEAQLLSPLLVNFCSFLSRTRGFPSSLSLLLQSIRPWLLLRMALSLSSLLVHIFYSISFHLGWFHIVFPWCSLTDGNVVVIVRQRR